MVVEVELVQTVVVDMAVELVVVWPTVTISR
jgi:hypothetical protein